MRTVTYVRHFAFAAAVWVSGCAAPSNHRVLYQVSTIDTLLAGIYDGTTTCGELKKHGDLGLGTFDALDGEMVELDHQVFQVRSNGRAYSVPDNATVPFAAVTFFKPDRQMDVARPLDLAGLEKFLDEQLATPNVFYAVRLDGRFRYVKTRSVPRQHKPYPPLAEVTKRQPTFEFHDIEGTLVALRCPAFVQGINVPAWHFHFLTRDRTAGGHVLQCALDHAAVQIASVPEFHLVLVRSPEFDRLTLPRQSAADLKKAEK